jgi:hypothetical protein
MAVTSQWVVTFDPLTGLAVSAIQIDREPYEKTVVVYATTLAKALKAADNLRGQ